MESMRKRIDVRLVGDVKTAERLLASSRFKRSHTISEFLEFVEMCRLKIYWNKPTYLGFCILDLSKLHMAKFHYDVIMNLYSNKARLLLTDTDSLLYEVETECLDADLDIIRDLLDTSEYPTDHSLYSAANAKRLGCFKNECGKDVNAVEFIGLRSKMYSLLLPGNEEHKRAKGIQKAYVKRKMRHADYKRCLMNSIVTNALFYSIR